jgi:hypothetical protein
MHGCNIGKEPVIYDRNELKKAGTIRRVYRIKGYFDSRVSILSGHKEVDVLHRGSENTYTIHNLNYEIEDTTIENCYFDSINCLIQGKAL